MTEHERKLSVAMVERFTPKYGRESAIGMSAVHHYLDKEEVRKEVERT